MDKPDPANPVGVKGVGEPPVGSAASAMVSAVSNALGADTVFARTPIVPDMIINAAAGRPQSYEAALGQHCSKGGLNYD